MLYSYTALICEGNMILVTLQLFLWYLWRLFKRQNSKRLHKSNQPPFYYTGSIGDVLGFSLVAYAASTHFPAVSLFTLCTGLLLGFLIATGLHLYWSRTAVWQKGSMYTTDYHGTRGAWIHNLYVFYIINLVCWFIVESFMNSTWENVWFFVAGSAVYATAMAADRYRGVI